MEAQNQAGVYYVKSEDLNQDSDMAQRSIADLKDSSGRVVEADSPVAAWDGGAFKGKRDHGVGEAIEKKRREGFSLVE